MGSDSPITDALVEFKKTARNGWSGAIESEINRAFHHGYAAGQQARTPGPATAAFLETLRFALSCGENRGPLYLNPEDVEGILAEWPTNANAPADDRGGEDAAG